jgi:hypothetical protein
MKYVLAIVFVYWNPVFADRVELWSDPKLYNSAIECNQAADWYRVNNRSYRDARCIGVNDKGKK